MSFLGASMGHPGRTIHPDEVRSSQRASGLSEVHLLEQRLARLEMITEAMWGLLRDELKLTDQQLQQRVAELDLSDGKANGRVDKGVLRCPKCNKANARRHEFCMWCSELLRRTPFD